jgi:GT2 family glycosyltransferase
MDHRPKDGRHRMPATPAQPRFHVIVGINDRADWLEACLAAVMAQSLPPWQVTVLGAGAANPAVRAIVARYPSVRLIDDRDRPSPATGCNRAAKALRDAQFLLLLDPDAILALDALEHLARVFAADSAIGILGCKVLDGDVETIHHVGLELRGNGLPRLIGHGQIDRGRFLGLRDVQALQQGAMAARMEVWCELGGLDEHNLPAHYEQIDLCLRARRAHWRVAVDCGATVTHFGLPAAPSAHLAIAPGAAGEFFHARLKFLRKHYTSRQWMTRFLPDEARWMLKRGPRGMRRAALRALLRSIFTSHSPKSRG